MASHILPQLLGLVVHLLLVYPLVLFLTHGSALDAVVSVHCHYEWCLWWWWWRSSACPLGVIYVVVFT